MAIKLTKYYENLLKLYKSEVADTKALYIESCCAVIQFEANLTLKSEAKDLYEVCKKGTKEYHIYGNLLLRRNVDRDNYFKALLRLKMLYEEIHHNYMEGTL